MSELKAPRNFGGLFCVHQGMKHVLDHDVISQIMKKCSMVLVE